MRLLEALQACFLALHSSTIIKTHLMGLSTPVASLIEASRRRWQRGIESFTRILPKTMSNRRPEAKVIRSAVYGDMVFGPSEMLFIESFYLQRLRRVSQMGLLNLVYPDARHSRFEHSLGALHSLKALLEADDQVRESLTDKQRATLYMAVLLHDCGHGPFSHTTESFLEMSGLDLKMRPLEHGEAASKVKAHERRGRSMILDTDFHLTHLQKESYGLKDALESLSVDPHDVAMLIVGQEPSPLANLLSGDFDVDKMDYFRRDAFFTGTMGGGVDMDALQRWIRIFGAGGPYPRATFDKKVIGHVLHMLYSREHVYNITAFHPGVRIASALLLVAGDLALRALSPEDAAYIYSHLELLDDQELLTVLQIAAEAPSSAEGEQELLRRTLERVYLRRLPKRLCTLPRSEFAEMFGPALQTLQSEHGDLPQIAYCRVSDIAAGKYLQFLAADDDVVLLEMTPRIGPATANAKACEREKKALSTIEVYRGAEQPIPLAEWIDKQAGPGASDSQASALRAYKLALWRALVLVPASLRRELNNSKQSDAFVKDFAEALAKESVSRPLHKTESYFASISAIQKRVSGWQAARTAAITAMSNAQANAPKGKKSGKKGKAQKQK